MSELVYSRPQALTVLCGFHPGVLHRSTLYLAGLNVPDAAAEWESQPIVPLGSVDGSVAQEAVKRTAKGN
jgi:hypothetical protein